MNDRIRKKWIKLGKWPLQRRVSTEWRNRFPFEDHFVEAYRSLEQADPQNPLLKEASIDTSRHFQLNSQYWDAPKMKGISVVSTAKPIAGQDYNTLIAYLYRMRGAARETRDPAQV